MTLIERCEGFEPGQRSLPAAGPPSPLAEVSHPLVGDPLAPHQHRTPSVVSQPVDEAAGPQVDPEGGVARTDGDPGQNTVKHCRERERDYCKNISERGALN